MGPISRLRIKNVLGLDVDLDFRSRPSQIVFVTGPPDSGKSRLMQALAAALDFEDAGACSFDLINDYCQGSGRVVYGPDLKQGFVVKKPKHEYARQRHVSYKTVADWKKRAPVFFSAYDHERHRIRSLGCGDFSATDRSAMRRGHPWHSGLWGVFDRLELLVHRSLEAEIAQMASRTLGYVIGMITRPEVWESSSPVSFEKVIIGTGNPVFEINGKRESLVWGVDEHLDPRRRTVYPGVGLRRRRRVGLVLSLVLNLIDCYGIEGGPPNERPGVVLIDDQIEADLLRWLSETFPKIQFFVSGVPDGWGGAEGAASSVIVEMKNGSAKFIRGKT
jgi:energy-coupling factor transporter ATP-binding protein EcfA2